MRDDSDLPLGPVGTIVLIIVALALCIWLYLSQYDDCMKVKNDPILCDIYARPR